MEPSENFDDLDQPTFFQRHPLAIGAVLALVAGVIAALAIGAFSQQKSPSRSQRLQVVQILPPPPPPPPPPTPPPQQATPPPEKMVEQQKMIEPEAKPKEELKKDEPPKPHEAPPGPLGLNAKGEGPGDAFGLVGRPAGNGLLGGGGGGGSRWGWYANEVQNGITTALRNNPRTRTSKFSNLSIRIWLDKGGRITRTQLSGSSGDPAVDNAIANEALSGLQMQEPPPGDMPMPILLRASASRP